jgi:hypothetical protein
MWRISFVTTVLLILALILLQGTILPFSQGVLQVNKNIAFSGTIEQRPLTHKQVIWADSSTETLIIDSLGQIYLNGTKTVAFGLNIVTRSNAGLDDKILTTLQNGGVRFMALDVSAWLNVPQGLDQINYWMPLLHNHKMWVALYIADTPTNPPRLNVAEQQARISGVINGITNPIWASMIFSVGYNWELDNYYSSGIADMQVATYLSSLYSLVKQMVDSSLIGSVPIVGKNMNMASNSGTTAIVEYSDIPNYDLYLTTTGSFSLYNITTSTWTTLTGDWQVNFNSYMTAYTKETLPAAGKSGMNIWFAEAGSYTNETDTSNYQFNVTQFNSFYNNHNTAAIFLWALQWDKPYIYAAFDDNGNPYPWFETILNFYSSI